MKCRRCGWPVHNQIFCADGYEYSVASALSLLKASPRGAITLPAGHIYDRLLDHRINFRHLDHVQIRYPVIAIPYEDSFMVIDGNHRAWKRLFRKLPVRAFLLTLEEVAQIRTKTETK